MILLTSVSDIVRVTTSAAGTVAVHASWVDNASGTITPGRTNNVLSTAATTPVVGSPAASTQRNIKTLTIRNDHASVSQTIGVEHSDGTTAARFFSVVLNAGELLSYTDGNGWQCFTSSGLLKTQTTPSSGWTFLGGLELTSAAVSTGVLNIAAFDMLRVSVRVTGYSGTDIASFRFNADSGANYWSRSISVAAGGTTLTNNINVSQTLARLFSTASTLQRSGMFLITNNSATSKVGSAMTQDGSGAAGTGAIVDFGGFEWVNTTAQITSIEMRTAGGTNTLSAGSGFSVEGINIP